MDKIFVYIVCTVLILLSSISLVAAEQRVVRVGAFNYYPAIFKDADGSVKGFYVDALAELGRHENIRFEYVYGSWSEGLERIKSGEVDLLTSVAYTEERAKFMDYPATPLLTVWGELYVSQSSDIDGIREVQGKKVAVMRGDFNGRNFIELTNKFGISCEFVEFPGFEDIFKAVKAKKVDAGVVNSTFGAARQNVFGLRSTGVVFNPFDIFFTVAKGKNHDLLALLDSYLKTWRHQVDSPYSKARQKWSHGSTGTISVIPRWLVNSATILFLLALVFGIFVVVLKKQVASKTRSLLESAEQYHSLYARQEAILAATPDIIMEVDTDRTYTWSNRAGNDFFGEDVVGKKADFYFAGNQEIGDVVRPLFEGSEHLLYVESWQRRKDGEVRLLAWWCNTLVDAQGAVIGSLSTARDITENKRAEESLAQQKALFEAIFSCIPDAIVYTNIDREVIGINPAFTSIFGFDMNDLTGKKTSFFYESMDEYERQGRIRYNLTAAERALPYEVNYRKKDGTIFPGETLGTVIKTGNGTTLGYIGVMRDISERKNAESERTKFEYQLQQTQKLESLGVLAGGIAHDFNNILMAIIGNADLALMRINKESPATENLQRIAQAAARAADLAKQMLAYSGKGKFVLEQIDLNNLLEDMLHMLEVSISKKAVLRLNLHRTLPAVEADATQLRQVIMNLVINASEAIGERSGVIAITTGCMDCDRSYLKDVWLDENISEGLYVYLEIADSGCGMDKATMAKLFDPFFTTKFTGRGLGMAAVLGIVRGHKGAIKVYSESGRGTTFKILLPASDLPVEIFNGESQKDEWCGSGTVLLVDDEETVRGIGKEMLQALGFTAITANDGRDAVEIFKANPDITLVVLDLTMPRMDGEQCFRELRQLKHDVKVIMSSGYNEQEVTQKFVGKGLAGFIQKPYKLSVLKETIRGIS